MLCAYETPSWPYLAFNYYVHFDFQIAKKDVQQLSNGQYAAYPYVSLELQWTGGEPVKSLCQKVPIKGTDDKDDFFLIRYYPQLVGECIGTVPYYY